MTTNDNTANLQQQEAIIDFLACPASYDPPPEKVDVIKTHAAIVFLAGDQVFKIKRAVRYSYLDFSTLEKRHRACLREIELNAPHAPQIYQGVVAITRQPSGRLSFANTGEIVEWAVKMRRFKGRDRLDRIIAENRAPPNLSEQLSQAVWDWHVKAARWNAQNAPMPPRQGAAGRLEAVVDDLFQRLQEAAPSFGQAAVAAYQDHLRNSLHRIARCLKLRGMAGYVRRCHGDLHLQNIVMLEGRPVVFDALEFDEELATIDVLYDLAFLLMDLDFHGRGDLANAIINHYFLKDLRFLAQIGMALLPLFISLRAVIRALVNHDRQKLAKLQEIPQIERESLAYWHYARRVIKPVVPRLIAIGGVSGSGKSTLARALAPQIGAPPGAIVLRSDQIRKILAGVAETTRLDSPYYHRDFTKRVYGRMLAVGENLLKAGASVVCDAVFADPLERQDLEVMARRAGVAFTGFWLEAPPETLKARVRARKHDASDATPDIVEQQLHYDFGPIGMGWHRLSAGDTATATLEQAQQRL